MFQNAPRAAQRSTMADRGRVSDAMRSRITAALDAGERPALRGNNLRLGSVVLQRTDGRDAPAMAEAVSQMRQRNIDMTGAFDTFADAAPTRRGSSSYAVDRQGREHRITRRARNGDNVPTVAGRRFYAQPYTRWLVHIPTILVRRTTGATFQTTRHDRTGEELGLSRELQARGSEEEQQRVVQAAVEAYLASAGDEPLDFYEGDEDVMVRHDPSRPIEYSVQTTGIRDGGYTADTILDRVVMGSPIFPEDMWQLGMLHETSRRRSGECGLDVIVASTRRMKKKKDMLTAEQAAEKLVALARELEPESALAQASFADVARTEEVAGIDEDLRSRKPDFAALQPFVEGMRTFLGKTRTVEEAMRAATKGHLWRNGRQETSFVKVARQVIPWTRDSRARMLLFLRWAGFHVHGEQVMLEAPIPDAKEIVRKCGTPVRLLVSFYEQLGVRLVLLNGPRCVRVWEPEDWATREKDNRICVIINVWSRHVSTYKAEASGHALAEREEQEWQDVRLAMAREDVDEHRYDDMQALDGNRPLVLEAVRARKPAVFWTTESIKTLDAWLTSEELTFIPYYTAPGRCSGVDIPFSDEDGHRKSVRIKLVPDNHRELRDICQRVQEQLKLKLFYKGQTAAVVGHEFTREYLVRRREAVPKSVQQELATAQKNRCARCNDSLRKWEVHHEPPVAEGWSATEGKLVLLCSSCHAGETEKQELQGETCPRYFESQLSPEMMDLFRTLPKPRQLRYGDPTAKAHAMRMDDFDRLSCLDVVGCRKNALLSYPILPVGTPLDCMVPVFTEDGRWRRPLRSYAWLWVEAGAGAHALYDGPHLYPRETVEVLMDEGFLQANPGTLPLGWSPLRFFKSSDLAKAWEELERMGGDKRMILGIIGLWNAQTRMKWYARKTDCEEDMPGPVRVKTFREDGTIMMCATEVRDNRTMLPASLLCLFREQVLMHRARALVAKVPRIIPLGCLVDGLFFVGPADAREELARLAREHRYEHTDAYVYKLKDASWREVPECTQISGEGRQCARPSSELGWGLINEDTCSPEVLEQDLRESGVDTQGLREKVLGANPRLDEFQVLAAVAAIGAGGAMISGAAGVGKSEVLRAIRDALVAEGHKVRVCAYTHAATRLVGGETIARLLHLNAQLQDTWFLIDEIGLLPLSTLGAMSRWCELGAHFVCFGDFRGQFEPFVDRWRLPPSRHEFSHLMHQLCRGLHITVTQYRRGADQALFGWYHGLYDAQEDVRQLVEESRRRYPARGVDQDPLVLTVSHAKRMRVNEVQNRRLAPSTAILLKWEGEDLVGTTMQPQTMRIWSGMTLIGCPRGSGQKKLVVQGVLYTVESISEADVTLQMQEDYRRGARDETVVVPLKSVCTQLRLCHAMCYYTCQGRTVRDRHIVLLDTDHPRFSTRALIVGMSRATHGRFVHIGDEDSDATFAGERTADLPRAKRQRIA